MSGFLPNCLMNPLVVRLSRDDYAERDYGTPKDFSPSDTLITKFLLGTVGCTPACDRYFILGFRRAGLR
jgi:hypothetical protein